MSRPLLYSLKFHKVSPRNRSIPICGTRCANPKACITSTPIMRDLDEASFSSPVQRMTFGVTAESDLTPFPSSRFWLSCSALGWESLNSPSWPSRRSRCVPHIPQKCSSLSNRMPQLPHASEDIYQFPYVSIGALARRVYLRNQLSRHCIGQVYLS